MAKPSSDLADRLYNILLGCHSLTDQTNRNILLRGLPNSVMASINRSGSTAGDLNSIIEAVRGKKLESGEWALMKVAKNAQLLLEGSDESANLHNQLTGLT